jgi:hypothetical protein
MFEVNSKRVHTLKKLAGKSGLPRGFDVNQFVEGFPQWRGDRLELIGAHMDDYLITSNVVSYEGSAGGVTTFKTESGSTYQLTPMPVPTGDIDKILPTE